MSLCLIVGTVFAAQEQDTSDTPAVRGSSGLNFESSRAGISINPQEIARKRNARQAQELENKNSNSTDATPNNARQVRAAGFAPQTTIRDEAFKEVLNKTFPLDAQQIKTLRLEHEVTQDAIHANPLVPPQPISSTIHVDLSPGAHPPIVRLAAGFVSSLVFLDSTAQPWPVLDYSLGNSEYFNIQWDSKTNALFVQSLKDNVTGNIAIRLAELDTPIMMSFVSGQREVDYRVDIQIPGRGPFATAPVVESIGSFTSSVLLNVLDGVPPAGSVEVGVANQHGRAWIYEGRLLFRTKLTLLSPAWGATVSSSDGTRVYELVQTPLLVASKDGKAVNITLSGL